MVHLLRPGTQTKVKVVPRDGELEITLNINISVDGKIAATADNADVSVLQEEQDHVDPLIPDLTTGVKLHFGKEE